MITTNDINKYVKFKVFTAPCNVGSMGQIIAVEKRDGKDMIMVLVVQLGIVVRLESQEEFDEKCDIVEPIFCDKCNSLIGGK